MIERIRKAFSGEQSIGRHPLFPAIVALWFCALFGLGGFALGGVALPGLDAPLGFGERIVLALVMAVIGGFVGARLARRMMRPVAYARRRRAAASDLPSRNAALFDEPDHAPAIPARRRPLATPAATTGDAPHIFAEAAPLPGGAPQVLDLAQADFAAFGDAPRDEAVTEADAEWDADSDAAGYAESPAPRVWDDMRPAFDDGRAAWSMPGDDAEAARVGVEVAAPEAQAADLPQVIAAEAAPESADAPEADPIAEVQPAPVAFCAAEGDSADRIADAPLDGLSSVELVERLGLSLQRRRAAQAAGPVDIESADVAAVDLSPVDAERDDVAIANELAPILAAMQHGEAASDDDEDAEPASAPDQPLETAPLRWLRADLEVSRVDAPDTPDAGDSVVAAWPMKPGIPRAFRPMPLADAGDVEAGDDSAIADVAPPRRLEMPARPRDDNDHDEGPIVTRHRRFGRRDEPLIAVDAPGDRAGMGEKRFSSLFDAGVPPPVRRPFIRIEDLDDGEADDAAESMVVFPWRNAGRDAAQAEAPGESGFDRIAGVISPTVASAPQPEQEAEIAAAPMAADEAHGRGVDMEETERALRSALASLKRISGAA